MSFPYPVLPVPPSINRFFRTDQVSWKWKMSTPALLGVATSASANVVQITHPDLITTTNTGEERNTIDGDFTADGVIDVANVVGLYNSASEYVRLSFNSVKIASAGSTTNLIFATVNGVSTTAPTSSTVRWFVMQSGLVPITFSDGRINGGAITSAYIEVRSVAAVTAAKIQVLRTIFDDETAGAPAGVAVGSPYPEFVPGRAAIEAVQRKSLENKIKKLKKKIKKLKKSGNSPKAKKLKKKQKKFSKKLAAL